MPKQCVISVDRDIWGEEKEVLVREDGELELVVPMDGTEFVEESPEQFAVLEQARKKWPGRTIGIVDA